MSVDGEYSSILRTFLSATPVPDHLQEAQGNPVFVLERIARGGGATRWYSLHTSSELEDLTKRLRPGSSVSFYFDQALVVDEPSTDARRKVSELMHQHGEIVVAAFVEGEIELAAEFPSSSQEFDDWLADLRPTVIAFGPFPGRDDAGAVTLDLPDADGVIRPQPH